jgi:hypothetical protein
MLFQSSQCWTLTQTTCSGLIDHNLLQNWWPAFLCCIYSISNLLSLTEVSITKDCATLSAPTRPEVFPTMAANSNMHNLATLIKRCVSYLFQYFPTSGIRGQAKDSAGGFVQGAPYEGCYRLDLTLLSICRERRFSSQYLPLRQTLG